MNDDFVQIRFESPDALRREFETNIVNRGIFVATEVEFDVRQAIDVEIILSYVDDSASALSLQGEVVHCVPVALATSGVTPGVAIQFDLIARDLRDAFEPLLGQAAPEPPPKPPSERVGAERREAKRGAVRVPVRIMPTMSPPFEATSRDLSATGILLSLKNIVLPIGEIVRTCLWHPTGDPSVEIDGKVVREVKNKVGRVAAVAVAFDRRQCSEPRVREVIDALRHAGHRSRLGGISGSIVDLGLANMLQMFGSSAPKGTLVVERDGEQGWIAFADGELLGAELGGLSDHDALVSMLDWGDGRFQFEATADERLVESAARRPLDAAVFEAVCALDEEARSSGDDEDECDDLDPPAVAIDGHTTFGVDQMKESTSRGSLGKTQEAVLELAKTGIPMAKLKSIIPEPEEEVQAALEALVELGVLVPR